MSTDLTIPAASPFDAIRRTDEGGIEYWSARELQPLLGYTEWRKFEDAIERAMAACNNAGRQARDYFVPSAKLVKSGIGADRKIIDYRLTRFAAYLVAMNSDPRKSEVAEAQTYFAIKTREAETTPMRPALTEEEIVAQALQITTRKVEALETRVAELEPKADTFDAFLSTVGDYSVNEAAKILARDDNILTGQGRLFGFMQRLGWIYRDAKGRPIPYQTQIEAGRLAAKAQFHYHPETGEKIPDPPQIRVTAKGLDALRTKYLAATA